MRYSCEEGYDYAEGYSVGEEDKGGVGGVGVGVVRRGGKESCICEEGGNYRG